MELLDVLFVAAGLAVVFAVAGRHTRLRRLGERLEARGYGDAERQFEPPPDERGLI